MTSMYDLSAGYGGHHKGHGCGCKGGKDDDGDLIGQLAMLLVGAAAGIALLTALTGGRRKKRSAAGEEDVGGLFGSWVVDLILQGRKMEDVRMKSWRLLEKWLEQPVNVARFVLSDQRAP